MSLELNSQPKFLVSFSENLKNLLKSELHLVSSGLRITEKVSSLDIVIILLMLSLLVCPKVIAIDLEMKTF